MTAQRDLKKIVRDRMAKTGESYTAARAQVLLAGSPEPAARPTTLEAVVLKVNHVSARVRLLGEDGEVTFRSSGVYRLAPGHLATLRLARRWTHRGYAYASGSVEDAKVDVGRLGLAPLPLTDMGEYDMAEVHEPFRRPDPYAPMWRQLTRKARPAFEMHPIAWDAVSVRSTDVDEAPVCDAAELAERGDASGARKLLMDVLGEDLRCIDAHAHLGNLVFDRSPDEAIIHYEIGVRIGELSLGPDFDAFLPWGSIYNRPFLRCLKGYALCVWRLGRLLEAGELFERILKLNPPDNQGVRFCYQDTRAGRSFEEACSMESSALH
jgi:tetratricopeptide (TPR) repeat protein